MTNPNPPRADAPRRLASALLIAALGLGLMLPESGCEKKKKKPPPPPPPAPVVAPPPDPVDINALVQELRPDARVKFVESQAPADRSLAEGVIRLADSVARGDSGGLRRMLDRPSQTVLDELVSSGDWSSEVKKIEQVRVVYLSDTLELDVQSATVQLAIQDPKGAYLLGWNARRSGDDWTFAAAPTPGQERRRASDFDGQRLVSATAAAREDEPAPEGEEGEDAAPAPQTPESAPGEAPEPGPRRKSTPAGPVTIPGG